MVELPNGRVSRRRYELFVDVGNRLFPEYSARVTPDNAVYASSLYFTLGQWEQLKRQVDAYFDTEPEPSPEKIGRRPTLERRKTVPFAINAVVYVRKNTGMELPTGFPAKFYEEIMNRLDL